MKNTEIDRQTIENHLPLVKMIAGRLMSRLPPNVEFDDLVGYGMVGLMQAFHEFDSDKKVKFSTFAFYRIKGAMLDGLRALDWLPRPLRHNIQRLEEVRKELSGELSREPREEEIATRMRVSVDEVHSLLFSRQQSEIISLEEELQNNSAFDPAQGNAAANGVEEGELVVLMADAIRKLEQKEQLVVSLYYHEGLNLKEIGGVIDVSESRVSQLLTQAIRSLREKLQFIHSEIQTQR